jgi:hypothetical protein
MTNESLGLNQAAADFDNGGSGRRAPAKTFSLDGE